jgi:hypothetical protein
MEAHGSQAPLVIAVFMLVLKKLAERVWIVPDVGEEKMTVGDCWFVAEKSILASIYF